MLDLTVDASPRACARCRTQLPVHALACPACSALVHREQLQQLAELAAAATAAGDRTVARAHWQSARDLVPADSEQQQLIAARMAALTDAEVRLPGPASAGDAPRAWWTRILAATATVSLLFVGKLKFLLLGLSKISTLASMFSFIAVYWSIHGWPLAVGLAGSIYIHEMGHVAMLRRLGIKSGAPLFIPGVGALVMLREHITDPVVDARVGLAGPVWGLGAAVTAWLVYLLTGGAIWLAIAELTGFLNLFNLMPVWQLDGARGFHVLSRVQRGIVTGTIAAALWLTSVGLLWIVGAAAAYQALRGKPGPGHLPTLLTFAGLVLALAWFARAIA